MLRTILLCGYLVLSQHMATDGSLWWRHEQGPISADECRQILKAVTGRPKVGFTKWYDTFPLLLEKHFGKVGVPEKGTWVACWPEGTDLGAPDS